MRSQPPSRRWTDNRGRSSNRRVIGAYGYPCPRDDEAAPWRTVLGVSTSSSGTFDSRTRDAAERAGAGNVEHIVVLFGGGNRARRRKTRRTSSRHGKNKRTMYGLVYLSRDLMDDEENEENDHFLVSPTFLLYITRRSILLLCKILFVTKVVKKWSMTILFYILTRGDKPRKNNKLTLLRNVVRRIYYT